MFSRLLLVVAVVIAFCCVLSAVSHEEQVWRDPSNTPCAKWASHREGHEGRYGMYWVRLHYCVERPHGPDASVYEATR